tara:strand:- start:289 stop:834 length:546 start_codon:yes stop_codon:yes gene_type:complete
MNIMRMLLLLIALVVLNVIFADRYLIPTQKIPSEQIIYSDEGLKNANEYVFLDSQVYLDANGDISNDGVMQIGNYKVLIGQAMNLASTSAVLTEFKAVRMPNDSFELTDLKIIIQYKEPSFLDLIKYDYDLNELENFSSMNTAVFSVKNVQQINETVSALSNDLRVENVSFNLVEMSEIPE